MATIPFATLQAADTRSAEMWTAVLGRAKNPQDVTEYLYGRTVDPDTGDVAIEIPARDAYLDTLLRADKMTAAELAALVNLYPAWVTAHNYAIGDLCAYSSKLYKCVQAHRSQADWHPDIVPALFTAVAPFGVIPAWVQPIGGSDAYALGALVAFQGQVWRSTIAANVWQPGVFGWVLA